MKQMMIYLAVWLTMTFQVSSDTRYDPEVLPLGREYFDLRDGLQNSHFQFEHKQTGRIAFLGGSITAGGGWRDHTMQYFRDRFPKTKFEFIGAGIGSMGSVPHAFRLERDVLSKGPVDLLFVEAAVNDTSNTSEVAHMLRGMEGVVRHARSVNPLTDIVHMHFVMPAHMMDYKNGKIPESIEQHEKVASAYGNPTLNISLEVTDRIQAGEFTWDKDFRNLHPSTFGHRIYANSIARMLNTAFSVSLPSGLKPHSLPEQVDMKSYVRGRFGSVSHSQNLEGVVLDAAWNPSDKKGTRSGFVHVPALVATQPGASFEFDFHGTGVGLFLTSGPDAGRVEFSIDNAGFRTAETFTRWSRSLHLPWAVILDDGLVNGPHHIKIRIAHEHHPDSTGTALRVFHFLLN